jgi:hypothetical protein
MSDDTGVTWLIPQKWLALRQRYGRRGVTFPFNEVSWAVWGENNELVWMLCGTPEELAASIEHVVATRSLLETYEELVHDPDGSPTFRPEHIEGCDMLLQVLNLELDGTRYARAQLEKLGIRRNPNTGRYRLPTGEQAVEWFNGMVCRVYDVLQPVFAQGWREHAHSRQHRILREQICDILSELFDGLDDAMIKSAIDDHLGASETDDPWPPD